MLVELPLVVRLPHGVEPLVHDLRDGRGRGDACVERHATYVSFRADAGGRNVSRDRAGRGSSGRTRESATRRRGEEDAFNGGIRRGRTRGAAGASAFARGKALKITAPGWTLSGKSGVGGETRGSAGIERGGGGAHLLADESTRDDDGHVHAGALFEEGKMGERRHEVSRRGWSLVETMCGRRTQGEGARPQMSRAAHRPKACTHRHGRPVESLEHDDRAVGLRCQRTPAVGGGEAADSRWEPEPRGGSARFFAQYRVQQ